MNSPINIKIVEVLEGDDLGVRAFALFLRPHPSAFRQLTCPHPREIAHFFQKMLMPGGWPGGGGGMGTAGIDRRIKVKFRHVQPCMMKRRRRQVKLFSVLHKT